VFTPEIMAEETEEEIEARERKLRRTLSNSVQ